MNILTYKSKNFPSAPPDSSGSISISSAKLCWAAITIGRPNKTSVRSFGKYSTHEALFRWNMVQAALDMRGTSRQFRNSDLFNALDPTEKGGINFYLGMIFAKIAAQDLLEIPWLVHYQLMTQDYSVPLTKGKSSPDLLGYSPKSRKWSVFEAKGRASGYSQDLMEKAKGQANNLTTVDGQACELYVGTQLYRNSAKQLKFAWEDPPPDEQSPRNLKSNRDIWTNYYAAAYSLYKLQQEPTLRRREPLGFQINLAPQLLALLEALKDPDSSFEQELHELHKWSSENLGQKSEDWFGDGIQIIMEEE
ncbi:hypothetical protein OU789_01445 [Halocynthiibacter sp. C4]|uniref:hypothetical protein n=1 Tax=Halocynthiibacter sp. C4 TaxID=2992758 RepID=UPI00237AF61E|nr:hypothetical protein [Halocynthiibacter sp. C4]MDE0588583.1 hypothetical protein [Halocynthiibacter sp. C4]